MKLNRLFCRVAIVAMLAFAAFALPGIDLRAATPAVETASTISISPVNVTTTAVDSARHAAIASEVAISPPDIANVVNGSKQVNQSVTDALILNSANEIATGYRTANCSYQVLRDLPPSEIDRTSEPNIGYEGRPPARSSVVPVARNGSFG